MMSAKGVKRLIGLPNAMPLVTSLASHTLRREEGSGHAAADELLLRNAIIEHSG